MKARKDQVLTVVLFCGFLAVMAVLYAVLPKQDFSQPEKRYLAESPELSWENIAEGGFADQVADYMADHMPFRDFFVGLNAYYDLWSGRQVTKDVYLAEDNRLVEAPVVWDGAAMDKNMTAINGFAETVEADVDLMVIPSAGWAAQTLVQGLSDEYTDDAMISDIYAMAGEGVRTVDVTDRYADGYELFYKTDHHWNSWGAWNGYQAYMDFLGKPYRAAEDFTVETVEGFQGSTYSRSGLWLTPGEPMELWHGSEGITVTNGENPEPHQGVFYRERLREADKYTVNLDGNHSIVRLENPDALTDDTLLVIRDSYSNSLGTFLTESYKTVILVDLRYFRTTPVSELCAAENVDNVLICYSIGNFMTDTNIVWLR